MPTPEDRWGRQLTHPNLDRATIEFLYPSEGVLPNITPPDGYLFAHCLTADDILLISTMTVDPTSLHPRVARHKVPAGKMAGRILLGNRLRLAPVHAIDPIMDTADYTGVTPKHSYVKLLIDKPLSSAVFFRRQPIDLSDERLVSPLDIQAKFQHTLPPSPEDVQKRLDAQRNYFSRLGISDNTSRGKE